MVQTGLGHVVPVADGARSVREVCGDLVRLRLHDSHEGAFGICGGFEGEVWVVAVSRSDGVVMVENVFSE